MASGASTSGIKMGRAYIVIGASDQTGRVLKSVSARMKAFGSEIQNWGTKALMTGIFGNIGSALALQQFTALDDIMRRIQAKSTGTADQFKILPKLAKSLAQETGVAATQIANLMEQLAQGGFNYEEIAMMTPDINRLALAGGKGTAEDQAMAADAVTQSIRSFNMEAKDAGDVADMLTVALNDSNFGLQDLIDTMAYVGPSAKAFDATLQDVIALSAVLRNVNVQASVAGTAVRNMFLQMSSKEGQEKFNEMLDSMTGKTIKFEDASRNLRPLPEILLEIGNATKGMGTAAKGELFQTLLGLRALVPASMLASDISGQLGGQFEKMVESLKNYKGEAQRTADITQSGVGGSLRKLLQTTIELVRAWGEQFVPMVQGATNDLKRLAIELTNWVQQNQKLVVGITAALALLPALGLGLITVGISFKLLAGVIFVVGTAFSWLSLTAAATFAILTAPVSVPLLVFLAATLPMLIVFWAEFTRGLQIALNYIGIGDQMFGKLFGTASEGFARMSDDVKMWGGAILDALANGEIQAAAKITFMALEALWMDFRDMGLEMWDTLKTKAKGYYDWWLDIQRTTGEGFAAPRDRSGQSARNDKINAQQQEINARRAAEISQLEGKQGPLSAKESERLALLRGAGQMNAGASFKEANQKAYTDTLYNLTEPVKDTAKEDKKARDEARRARKEQLEDELKAISAEMLARQKAREEERAKQFQGGGQLAGGNLPKGIGGQLAGMPGGLNGFIAPASIQARMAGTFEAANAVQTAKGNQKSPSELLEEQNKKMDESNGHLDEIQQELKRQRGGMYV